MGSLSHVSIVYLFVFCAEVWRLTTVDSFVARMETSVVYFSEISVSVTNYWPLPLSQDSITSICLRWRVQLIFPVPSSLGMGCL